MPKRKANNEVEQPQDKKKQKLSERSVNIPMPTKEEQRNMAPKKQIAPTITLRNSPARTRPHNQVILPEDNPNRIVDIDEKKEDPIYCTTYSKDIALCLLASEDFTRDYIFSKFQSDINTRMRMILMDWIVEVVDQYNLSSKAHFLTKKIIDLMLGKVVFTRNQLQLLGVVAILIAAKFEDIQSPTISELVFISDNSCTVKEIKELEVRVLNELNYELTIPTEVDFLPRFISAACYSYNAETVQKVTFLANFFAETTLLHYHYIKYKPSTIAVVCVSLALATLGLTVWNRTLTYYSPIPCNHQVFAECMTKLLKDLKTPSPNGENSVQKKYAQNQYLKVSELPLPDSVPYFNVN